MTTRATRRRSSSRMSIPTIRGALVVLRMWTEAWTPSTQEVQEYLGMADHSGAYRLMCRLSGAKEFPIYQDDNGRWRRTECQNSNGDMLR